MPTTDQSDAAHHPWVYRASVAQLATVAALAGGLFWAIVSGLDLLWSVYSGATVVAMATGDAILSLTFGAVLLKLMLSQRARHRKVVQQLQLIAEMNHHIRNALENIESSAYILHDAQFMTNIHSSVQRIDWALREVLPRTANERDPDESPEEEDFGGSIATPPKA